MLILRIEQSYIFFLPYSAKIENLYFVCLLNQSSIEAKMLAVPIRINIESKAFGISTLTVAIIFVSFHRV